MEFDPSTERELAASKKALMYEAQAAAFEAIISALQKTETSIFFIDGPGGSGKSFLFDALMHHTQGKENYPLLVHGVGSQQHC